MRYLVIFVIICVLICNDVNAKKKKKKKDKEVECLQCETANEDSSCRDGTVSSTCKGKYCYYYTFKEIVKAIGGAPLFKYWYMRGCSTKKKICRKEGISNCVVCNETRCNNELLPTMITPLSAEYFG
ncbi:uncharacterized protein LOC123682212 isoform X7 [Harmonia axyridis]|uniref:uncharacterized protein LOC123682212 isoform X7 n=1 Tax=Harmonia axyridis TaxID=115357 RepID=UPI001E27925A|nr:uncharacterized protein LOC123682212 isoform X7 [Harmonia axyridis]